jgi:hypothetical protein
MKKTVITIFAIAGVACAWSLASLAAEERPAPETVVRVPSPATADTATQPQTAGNSPVAGESPVPENTFALEKLAIGLGLAVVIALAVFRWGAGSKPRKQE